MNPLAIAIIIVILYIYGRVMYSRGERHGFARGCQWERTLAARINALAVPKNFVRHARGWRGDR